MKTLIAFLFSVMLAASMASCSEKEIPSPAPGNEVTTGTVKPDRDEEVFLIRGHIRNTSGNGIASASAELLIPGQTTVVYSATTASDGSYSMSNVAKGSYTLRLSATGYITQTSGISVAGNIAREDTLVAQ